jgi:hypothetical protein
MRGAHPILPIQAVATLPTRHDLLSNHAITHRNSPTISRGVIKLNNFSDELVSRNDLRLSPGWTVFISPELRRTVITLQVTGTNAVRLDLDQRLPRSRPRNGDLLQLIIFRPMTDNGLHGVGNVIDLVGRGIGHASLHAP